MINTVYLLDISKEGVQLENQVYKDGLAKSPTQIGKLFRLYCLKQSTNLSIENLQFSKGIYGKPFLKEVEGVHFNLSHKSGIYVFVCSNQPIGIDIENAKIGPLQTAIKRFFSAEEWSQLNSNGQNNFAFAELWSLKESYAKYLGLGLRLPFSSFSITKSQNFYCINGNPELNLRHFLYQDVFHISLCSEVSIEPVVHKISEKTVREAIMPMTQLEEVYQTSYLA